MKKLLYGIGLNDAPYITRFKDHTGKEVCCPFYRVWRNMFMRAYCKRYHEKHPTYIKCFVANEWHSFMSFREWMVKQEWKGNQLDKDILFENSKIYSPDTCVFVNKSINQFITDRAACRGDYLIGVCYDKERCKYISSIGDGFGNTKFLGRFDTEKEAHAAWVLAKYKAARELADTIKRKDIGDAIISRYEKLFEGFSEPNLRRFIPKHLRGKR